MAQLFHASKLELDEFKYICATVQETIFAGGNLEETKFFDRLQELGGSNKAQLDIDDVRACFAAVNYIMTNSVVYQVSSKQIHDELEQLGLPSEHSSALCDLMNAENIAEMHQQLIASPRHCTSEAPTAECEPPMASVFAIARREAAP